MKVPISIKIEKRLLTILFSISGLLSIDLKSNKNKILCYHSISQKNDNFSISVKEFRKQILKLSKTKTISNINEVMSNKIVNNNRVVITFDDGFRDVFENVYPLFKTFDIQGCVFVVGENYLNSKAKKSDKLTLNQLKMLNKAGWDIGYHSYSHKDLTILSKKELEFEIAESKKELEKKLGFKINYFAYPFGGYSRKVVNVVEKSEYKAAFTVDGGSMGEANVFKMSRVCMSRHIKAGDLEFLLTDVGLCINSIVAKIVRLKDIMKSF